MRFARIKHVGRGVFRTEALPRCKCPKPNGHAGGVYPTTADIIDVEPAMTRLDDELRINAGTCVSARRQQHLAVQTSHGARFNNDFFIVWPHHNDLATELIRQRTGESVDPVSFVPQIG